MGIQTDIITLRCQGKETFQSLALRHPALFQKALGCRGMLLSLPHMRPALPAAPAGPWRIDQIIENADSIEIRYRADERWVDYHLGFLEAMLEYCGEPGVILVQALPYELRFKVSFETVVNPTVSTLDTSATTSAERGLLTKAS